jgi:Pectate lyase superfamily protein
MKRLIVTFLLISVEVAAQERRRSAHMLDDVMSYGAVGDGVTDDTAAIQAALDSQASTGAQVTFPCGRYRISSKLMLRNIPAVTGMTSRGPMIVGEGQCSVIESDDTGTGFTMMGSGEISRACTGGTGACDVRLGRSGRGDGCYCQTHTDCNSATCTQASGTTIRGPVVRDLTFIMRKDNMVALDLFAINEGQFENLRIQTADGLTHTNTVGVVFTDGNPAFSGYSNTLYGSTIMQSDVCLWARDDGNDNRILSDTVKQGVTAGCGSGLVIEDSNSVMVTNTMFQSTKAPVCGGTCTANTCCGGYNHGATCSVATDCNEGSVLIHANATQDRLVANRFEDSANPHIILGCEAVAGGPCPTSTAAIAPAIIASYHSGTGQDLIRTNVSVNFPPLILEGGGVPLNIIDLGADAGGVNDNCSVWQELDSITPTTGIRVFFPPGSYLSTCPLKLRQQSVYQGAGAGATTLQTPTTGTGFALMQVTVPRTCTGGTGDATTCDDTVGGATRGPGCVCYTNADCQSGTCAGGTVQRGIKVEDLKFLARVPGSIGIDYALVGESMIENVLILGDTAGGEADTIGINLSDGGGTVSGYSNTILHAKIQQTAIGIRVMDRANQTVVSSSAISICGNGIQLDSPSHGSLVIGNVIQSNVVNGILDNTQRTTYTGNYFEDDTTKLNIGATATNPRIDAGNDFTGAGVNISNNATTTRVEGLIYTDTPSTCAAALTGFQYVDTSLSGNTSVWNAEICVCNGTNWCQVDGGGCTSSTSCG